jgi:hypothetical protein
MMKPIVWILVLALISLASAFEVSPANPSPGEEIVIDGTSAPNEEVRLRSSFQMDLPVSGGKYEYETRVLIPQKPNRFTVTARNVKDLNAGVKMVIWITKRFEASGGVATVSQSDVPPGKYSLKMFGEALPAATVVPVKVEAETAVKADSEGRYSLAIDTSGIPAGDYNIEGDGDSKTIRIGSPIPTAISEEKKDALTESENSKNSKDPRSLKESDDSPAKTSEKENMAIPAGTAEDETASSSSENKGFIGGVMEWIWG